MIMRSKHASSRIGVLIIPGSMHLVLLFLLGVLGVVACCEAAEAHDGSSNGNSLYRTVDSTGQTGARDNVGPAAENDKSTESVGAECAARLESFVTGMDQLFARKLEDIQEVLDFLKQHFPMKGCNIPQAIESCRRSQYFVHVSENPHSYVISFNSKRRSSIVSSGGVDVQFSLMKGSGDTGLPWAMVRK